MCCRKLYTCHIDLCFQLAYESLIIMVHSTSVFETLTEVDVIKVICFTVLCILFIGKVVYKKFFFLSLLFFSGILNNKVAVLDIDICGPSIPRVMGLEGEQVHQSGSGWSPVVSGPGTGRW